MAEEFLERGYAVDVIDFTDTAFMPRIAYDICIDVGANLERLAPMLGPRCIKVFHVTTTHWRFNNEAEQRRLDELASRRGVEFPPERMIAPHRSAETADILLLLGNAHTTSTYAHVHVPFVHIPISSTFTYPAPDGKDIERAQRSFVWLGGAGLVHKGVDVLLEAFATMPEYRLHLCGKTDDAAFSQTYARELALPNIMSHGVLDLGSERFRDIVAGAIAVLSPSCAEGQSGAVIVGMHAGLIPIVSRESGIDTHNFGFTLDHSDAESIRTAVRTCANTPRAELERRAHGAWQYARDYHTRDAFARNFSIFANQIESMHNAA
jgi:glycosyltransferase involved in cell wall biosynthesis